MGYSPLVAFEFWEGGKQIVRVVDGGEPAVRFRGVLESAGMQREQKLRRKVAHDPDRWEPLPEKMFAVWELT